MFQCLISPCLSSFGHLSLAWSRAHTSTHRAKCRWVDMFKEMKKHRLRLFMFVLTVVVIVLAALTLYCTVTVICGSGTTRLILLIHVTLTIFSAGLLTFWIVRYRQTSHDLETLREEIRRRHGNRGD